MICGAYLLPRVAQAVTRRVDPLSLKLAAKSKVGKASVSKSVSLLKPVSAHPLVLIPKVIRMRTPSKPPAPVQGPTGNPGPPSGLSFT